MELLDEVGVDECCEHEIRLASRAFIYLLRHKERHGQSVSFIVPVNPFEFFYYFISPCMAERPNPCL
jgi:hypothetical protein